MLRIGILGAARVATYAVIAPARSMERVTIAAVAARDSVRAAAYAAEHGIARVHATYALLFDDPDIDLVYVATPPSMHAAQAIRAIESGKAVLVEKPFAMNAAEARTVFDLARKRGVPVFEAMHSPHHRLFRRVMELAQSGEVGEVHHLDAEFNVAISDQTDFRWNPELGGGALMDLGVYPLAWTRRLAGDSFTVVDAKADFLQDVDASFHASLQFGSGVTGSVRSSMTQAKPSARLIVEGTLGRLEVINPVCPQIGHSLNITNAEGGRSETVNGPSTYEHQLAAVCSTLLDNEPFPFPADDFVHSMEAIDLIRAAMRVGT